jgi:ABC-2 type transport system permease protein
MQTTKILTISAIKMFVRNRQSVFFSLFIPIVIMLIFGAIGFDRVLKISVGIVSSDPSPATTAFIDQLKTISAFEVTVDEEEKERQALEKGDRAIVALIPNDLIPTDPSGPLEQRVITVLTNVSEAQQAQTATSILTQVLDQTTFAVANVPRLFELKSEEVSAQHVRYIDFLLPGIVAMAVMQMAVFSVAFVFVDYKERGILKRLLATPMKPIQFLMANVVTRLLVALVQSSILIALGVLVFDIEIHGSLATVLLVTILGGIMFLGMGFTISGIAKTTDAVPAIANILVFPMMFLSGVFFPTEGMPTWLQSIVQYLPLTYFAHGLREVMAGGARVQDISVDLLGLAAWAVILLLLANITFRFEEKRV